MKKSICPECGGMEFYKREVNSSGGYGPDLLPGTGSLLKHGKFEIHVCGKCGFTKWFVAERFLKDIKDRGKFKKG